jgi:hypothetical protein
MFTFITTVLVVSLVAFCFWGKRFWEYRYIVLLIIAGVSLVATIIINYSVRGGLETKVEVISKKPLHTFYIRDSLFTDTLKTRLVRNWDFYKLKASVFNNYKDTVNRQTPVTFIIYTKKKGMYVGHFKKGTQGLEIFDEVYFAPSSADSVAYVCRKKLVYDVPPNNWLTGFSLPRVSTMKILYVPPSEYALIPDSLIRKIPF